MKLVLGAVTVSNLQVPVDDPVGFEVIVILSKGVDQLLRDLTTTNMSLPVIPVSQAQFHTKSKKHNHVSQNFKPF